ncbi:MAG: SMC-Scp complex subunit ScpB [Actinobacteria bacterium]|nr:SMC-Scp complex subunit ScpB [Actinomycetota bacterium]
MAHDEDINVQGAIEAMLFVSDEPVSAVQFAKILEITPGQVESNLAELSAAYRDRDCGIQLREVAGGWRFYTHPAHHEIIEKYVISWDTRKLSQAALEALAVVAYHQPVTRGVINAIRGVNSEAVVSSLIEKGLVREVGRDEGPGNAILYGTTRTFLEKFGLKSIKDLPPLEEFAPDEDSKQLIRERLSSSSVSSKLDIEEDLEDADDEGIFTSENEAEETSPAAGFLAVVEPYDAGDDVRVDDAQAMSEVLSVSMTEKVSFDDFEVSADDDLEEID